MTALAASSAFDQPGTLGFLVVFGMAVVLYFVFRSMAKHLRKVKGTGRQDAAAPASAAAPADKPAAASAPTDSKNPR